MRIHGVVLLVVLLGCGPGKKGDTVGNDDPPARTPDAAPSSDIPDDLTRVVENEIAVLERIAEAARSGADCDAVEANLRTIAEGPDGQAMGKAGQHPGYVTHQAEIEIRYMSRIDTAIAVLLQAMKRCEEHPGVQDVMTKLGF